MSGNITIERKTLARVLERFAARIPDPTKAEQISIEQRSVNKQIAKDRDLHDEVVALIHPNLQKAADDFGAMTLEELRFGREVALHDGNAAKAFALATAIDRKRGFY